MSRVQCQGRNPGLYCIPRSDFEHHEAFYMVILATQHRARRRDQSAHRQVAWLDSELFDGDGGAIRRSDADGARSYRRRRHRKPAWWHMSAVVNTMPADMQSLRIAGFASRVGTGQTRTTGLKPNLDPRRTCGKGWGQKQSRTRRCRRRCPPQPRPRRRCSPGCRGPFPADPCPASRPPFPATCTNVVEDAQAARIGYTCSRFSC